MALVAAVQGQVILSSKANEHNSAIGRTPPVIMWFAEGADPAAEMAQAMFFKAAIVPLQVANVFAGVSLRPSAGIAGEPVVVEAATVNDWPEANQNRVARILLSDDSGKATTTLQIPYIADAVTDVGIRTALLTELAARDYRQHGGAGAPRLTKVIRVAIVAR